MRVNKYVCYFVLVVLFFALIGIYKAGFEYGKIRALKGAYEIVRAEKC